MGEPKWAQLLQTIYRQEEMMIFRPYTKAQDTHILRDKTGLGEKEIPRVLTYMERQGLIKSEPSQLDDSNELIQLTEKGFDVAHEREQTKAQYETNQKSTRLSAYLVIAIIIQSLISINQYSPGWELGLIGLLILSLTGLVGYEIFTEYWKA